MITIHTVVLVLKAVLLIASQLHCTIDTSDWLSQQALHVPATNIERPLVQTQQRAN